VIVTDLELSHLPEDLGLRIGENESRRQDLARASSTPKLAHDPGTLCQVDVRGQVEGAGYVSAVAV